MRNKLAVKLPGILLIGFCGFLSGVKAAPGDLDTTFATTGFTREASSIGSNDSINATVIQPDGRIVSVGKVNYGGLISCGIARHNADGTLDTSFDGDGLVTTDFFGGPDHSRATALQSDGQIVIKEENKK